MFIASQFAQYSSTYTTTTTTSNFDPVAIFVILYVLISLFFISYILYAWFLGRVFRKAGLAAWIAWVPFYSTWKMLELGNQRGFWAVLSIIPIVSYASAIFLYIAMYHIGLRFGKSGAWVILAIFFPHVWLGILAFDSSKWQVQELQQPQAPVN